jgi:WD40 repeat protein
MEDWTSNRSRTSHEILREHLRCGALADGAMSPQPDLAACLDARADLTAREGVRRFAEALRSYTGKLSKPLSPEYACTAGQNIIRGAFRALAQHDDRGNWARRFAEIDVIETFSIAGGENSHLKTCHYAQGISTALSSFVSHGYLVFKDGYYDISHEALIRNWKQYQEWLRDPQEISRALTRAVADLDPGHLAGDTPEAKDDLVGSLPPSLCASIEKALKRRELPEAWVVEQILPLVNRPDVVKRWGTRNPNDLLATLDGLVARAQCIRTERASARARKERNRWLIIAGTAATCLLLVVGFSWWREHEASQAALTNHSKSIALHADDHLDHEGPAQAILVATQAQKAGLPDIPEVEQVIYKSLRQLREKRALPAPTVNSATSDPPGKILAGVSAGGLIQFWRLADGALIDHYDLDITGPAQTMGMNWSPDGTRLAIGVGERTALVMPCSHSKLLPLFSSCGQTGDQELTWLGAGTTSAGPGKFSKDGKFLITGNWRSRAKIWNIETGEHIDLGVDTAFPWAVALAPDMQTAAIGTGQGTIHIINLTTHEDTLLKIPGSDVPGAITSVDFGNRSDSLLVATQNGQVWLFNVTTRTPTRVAGQHGQAFQTAFSSDGRRVATASGDGGLRIWPVDRVSEQPFVLRGHDGPVYSLQFIQDGETLVSASADGTIRIWSVVSALHPDVGRNSSSAQPPIDAPYSPTPPADRTVREGPEIRATNAQGYTIVAYNGTNSHLSLFGPGSTTTPISEWGDRIPVKWRSVSFGKRPDKNDDSDLIVAVSITGETYSWPHFKDFMALTKYAIEQLPYLGQKQLELPEMELCKLDLMVDRSKCSVSYGN